MGADTPNAYLAGPRWCGLGPELNVSRDPQLAFFLEMDIGETALPVSHCLDCREHVLKNREVFQRVAKVPCSSSCRRCVGCVLPLEVVPISHLFEAVSYTHLRAH